MGSGCGSVDPERAGSRSGPASPGGPESALAALGLPDADDETLSAIARRATVAGETIHNEPFPVDAAMVVDALRTADALGR
ncbi:hypothetical protein [Nocardia sp. NPDC057455]|uniref:hypothetical protein n=1 Tax=Nocardia sp. NPDC057455 TaxID=3346138 RepID=UPI003670D0E0